MPRIVVAADADWVHEHVRSRLLAPDTEVIDLRRGADVLPTVRLGGVDIVVLDLQIGNMGAAAVCRDLRHEEEAGRLPRIPVLMLLDRVADVFQARRADADAWLVKPIPPRTLARTVALLLDPATPWSPEVADAVAPLEADFEPAHGGGGEAQPETTA